jgi:hypothetical protein
LQIASEVLTTSTLIHTALDAVDNLKRAFKGIFKRNKKTSGTPSSSQPSTQQGQSSQPPQVTTTSSEAGAPQIAPLQNASGPPLTSTIETSKPLPPTHPLSTGQQDKPQEAVPQNHDAQPGPPAPVVSPPAEQSAGVDGTKEEQQPIGGAVSPFEQGSTVDESRSGAVSAVTENTQNEEPAKTETAVESAKATEPTRMWKHKG